MGLVWGAGAADAQPSARAVGGHGAAAVGRGGGGGTEHQEHPPRFGAGSHAQAHDGFGAGLDYYHPYSHHVFSPHLAPLAVDSASAFHLDDDSSSSHTTPVTPYSPLPAAPGHYLQSSPASESRRGSLPFHEVAASSVRAAFAFDVEHQQPWPHSVLSGAALGYRMSDVDDAAPCVPPPSRRPSPSGRGDQALFLSEQPPARLAAYTTTTNLVLRQGRPPGSRSHPGPAHVRDGSRMALDDSGHASPDLSCAAESDGNATAPRAEEVPASTARRPRGRPRLETNDETPIERRRTQVRLAQRGFRQRKDNHLKNLERRVGELEGAYEAICAEFAQFHEFLRAERALDAHPLAAQRLQAMADKFFASALAAKEASGGSGDSLSSDADNEPPSAHDAGPPSQVQRSLAVGQPLACFPGIAAAHHHFALSLPCEAVAQASPEDAGFPLYACAEPAAPDMMTPCHGAGVFPRAADDAFGRRLQRASVEASWRLITMANPPAEQYAAVFGVRLFFEPPEAIIRRLRLFFGNPFQCDAASPPDEGPDHWMRVLYPGLEREVFSADEVEAHLGRLGIAIPQNATYVEAEVSLDDLEETSSPQARASSSPVSWPAECFRRADAASHGKKRVKVDPERQVLDPLGYWIHYDNGLGKTGSFDVACSRRNGPAGQRSPLDASVENPHIGPSDSAGGAGPDAAWPGSGHKADERAPTSAPGTDAADASAAPATRWPRASLAIDVNVLINELALRSVCVGKVPGVRRMDVNRAVKLAAGLGAA